MLRVDGEPRFPGRALGPDRFSDRFRPAEGNFRASAQTFGGRHTSSVWQRSFETTRMVIDPVRATAPNVRVERLCPPRSSWYQTGRRAGKVRSNDKLGGAEV